MDSNQEINYKIVLEFDSFSKVGEFLSDLEAWQAYKAQKLVKKENDRRGLQTKENHKRAREYHALYPILTYRESFRLANT